MINYGWYTVYLLILVINAIVCSVSDQNMFTWQYCVHAFMIILSFVAGASYKKE